MPTAITNINVNGRWYDAGDDLSDCSEEELADLDQSEAVAWSSDAERTDTLGEDDQEADGTDEEADAAVPAEDNQEVGEGH